MARRSKRVALVTGVVFLAAVAAVAWFLTASTTGQLDSAEKVSAPPAVSAGAGQPAAGSATGSAAGSSGPASVHPSTPPVPALAGDGYVRNVVPGASCAPVGGRGFTSQSKLMRCTTATPDRRPRWRAP